MAPFRLSAYTVFLTYPKSGDTTKEELLAFIQTIGRCDYAVVGKELHEDGSPHLHAVAKFKTKLNIRNEKAFDYNGNHPNIQAAREFNRCCCYAKKDGDFVEHGTEPSELDVFFDYHFRY